MAGSTDGVTDKVYSNGLIHHSSDSVEEKLDELRHLMGKAEGDPLRIVGVGAGAWGSVFVAMLQDSYGHLRDKVLIRIWRRPGRSVDRATAEHLFEVINSREDVLRRLIRRCAYLKYVEARLGDRTLFADELLKDGFCVNMIDTPLCPMKVVTNLQEAVWDADIVVNGLPSTETHVVFEEISRYWKERVTMPVIISLSKGVEAELEPEPRIITPTQIINRATGVPNENILYLGGPNIASEIYNNEYANARICGADKWRKPLAKFLRQPHFIVWDNGDLVTHEVMGGLKNVYAIGAGMVAALTNESATSKAVYFAHCTSEMIFITHLLAEEPEKLAGPLLADTYVTLLKGRNAWYGQKLAKGELSLEMGDSIKGKGMIQGVSAVKAFFELLSQPSLSIIHPDEKKPVAPVELCPILKMLYRILIIREFPPQAILQALRDETMNDPRDLIAIAQTHAFYRPSLLDDEVPEEEKEVRENKENEPQQQVPRDSPGLPTRPHTQSVVLSHQWPESSARSSAPSIQQLPDASLLLNSPVFSSNMVSGSDHSSRVAAAMAESSSRKRELNAFGSSVPRSKVPRGSLLHSKSVPDTVGGLLVPPQLSGRSNIVTEDVGKLFVKKQADHPPKKRGLSFSCQEDVLLTQGWLATNMDVVHIKGQSKTTYWGRVTDYFHSYKTFASDREERSLLQRWSAIQQATKKFCEYVTQAEEKHKYGVNGQDKYFYAKQLYEKLEKKKFPFDHCWKLLKDAPKWLDDMRKPRKKPTNRGKGTSLAPEFSSPSTSESLIGLVEDDVPNTEFGKKERLQIRKDAPDGNSGNRERLLIGNDALNSDVWNRETPPKRMDIPNTGIGDMDVLVTDFGNTERPPMRNDIPNTDFGSMERPPIRTDVQNTDLENMDASITDVGNMERPPLRKGIPNTDSGNMERPTTMMDVLDADFGSMERPPVRLVEKPKIEENQKNDDANKQAVDLLHMMEEWRDQVNEEKRQYRLEKLEMLRERLEMDKERLEMDKERLRLDREDKEERIMLMDISIMPHQLQQYYHRRRMEILARGMGGV
ncbi:unnamed protein product [Malus baccata var. baccata]